LRRASRSSSAGLTAQSRRVATGNRSSRPCCTALPTTRIGRFNWDCRGISGPIDLSRLLPEVFDRASQQKSLHAPGKLGIEAIAQAIPHQINGQHSYGYKKAREENNPEGQLDIGTAFSHDIPPTGDIRGSPCTQEAEVGLDNDRRGANISGLHQYWRQRIGMIWRNRIRGIPAPAACMASTKGCSRKLNTSARTRRTTRGISGMVRARMTLRTLARINAIRAMASKIPGIAIIPSITRMTTASRRR
jgi:hypothetical protein